MFDICLENKIYFFVRRNIDNSIKIYEQELKKKKSTLLQFSIPTKTFVSCLHRKDKYLFFSGFKMENYLNGNYLIHKIKIKKKIQLKRLK